MMETADLYALFLGSAGVNTDTRTLVPGQIFVALKGENFDGNGYALKALEAGASYAIVNEDVPFDDARLVKVHDPLRTLKELAAYHRRVLGLPVIGLTGTNGKTTTKELIRTVLETRYRVIATEGNLNNDIGVPLSVLRIGPDTEVAVIEMGANHPDDISALTWVSQPDYGLITNVGKAHLLGFGSFEGVCRAKGQLYDYLAAHGGKALVNADSPYLPEMAAERGLTPVFYGVKAEGAEILPPSLASPYLRMNIGGHLLETRLAGAYNADNVMAALAVSRVFDIPLVEALSAIAAYSPTNNRSQLVRTERNLLIEDAYNANPSSMAVALDNLARMSGRKVALLGDMRELGAESAAEHEAVIRHLSASGVEAACLVGEEFRRAAMAVGRALAKPDIHCFATSDELAAWLSSHPFDGCTILVKGSRGTRMEKVLGAL